MTKQAGGRWWPVVGTIALLLVPGSLGLFCMSLAALLVAAGPRRPREYVLAAGTGVLGLTAVAWTTSNPLASALGTYTLIVATAFAGGALVAPAGVLRQAWRATVTGIAAVALLGFVVRGPTFWSELYWSVVRHLSSVLRFMVQVHPDAYRLYEPVVRALGRAYPALVILQTLAGLALAWHWHTRLALAPLETRLGSSHEPHREGQGGVQHRDREAKSDESVAAVVERPESYRSMNRSTVP